MVVKKGFLTLICLFALHVNSQAQKIDWESENVMGSYPITVWQEYQLDKLPQSGDTPITECFGYSILPNVKGSNMGILIYHDGQCEWGLYHAYDLECQGCAHDGVHTRITMVNYMVAECKRCGAQYYNISNGAGNQSNRTKSYDLIRYCVYVHGNTILVTNR